MVMKKLFVVTMCMAMLLILPMVALAEEVVAGTVEPYTWAYLGTLAGATAATLLIVQFTKAPLDKVWKIPTRLLVYVIALIILLVAQAFTGGLTGESAMLAALNAVVVAMAAYGSYELTFNRGA
jgi:hypothetical protein